MCYQVEFKFCCGIWIDGSEAKLDNPKGSRSVQRGEKQTLVEFVPIHGRIHMQIVEGGLEYKIRNYMEESKSEIS